MAIVEFGEFKGNINKAIQALDEALTQVSTAVEQVASGTPWERIVQVAELCRHYGGRPE